MKSAAFAILMLATPGLAQDQTVISDCRSGLLLPFEAGRTMRMTLRSGEVHVTGAAAESVRVSCEFSSDPERSVDTSIQFKRRAADGELRVWGGPGKDFRIRIEVPGRTHLVLRSPAGEVTVSNVIGDKDVRMRAGELNLEAGNPAEYRYASASVRVGELNAPAFGVNKGGFFRSFKHQFEGGTYRLTAKLTAGEVIIR